MELDLFTFAAQVFNFLILLLLLRVLLYKPVIRAMDERQRRIASGLKEAEERERRAEEEAESYRHQRQKLEERRAQMLSEARRDVEGRRAEWIDEARREVDESRKSWQEALERRKQAFLSRLQARVAEETCRVARRALKDLADEELEAKVVAVFGRRLDALEGERREDVTRTLCASNGVSIRSAFALDQADRSLLEGKIRALCEQDLSFDYRRSDDLMSGIELRAGDCRISWSLESYLGDLEERMRQAIKEGNETQTHV